MRVALAALLVLASIAGAHAFGMGKLGFQFGRLGAPSGKVPAAPGGGGKILLVDGASFVLQTDAASKICRAGGC